MDERQWDGSFESEAVWGQRMSRNKRDISNLQLKDLIAFVAVCDAGRFTQAAVALHASRSALSRSVKGLEDWCHTQLLVRTSREVMPTREGLALLPLARRMVDEARQFMRSSDLVVQGRMGRLAIGYMDVSISDFLPALIGKYRQDKTEVDIDLRYGWRSEQRKDLLAGKLDIAFTVGTLADRQIVSRKVKDYRLCIVAPISHPIAKASETDLAAVGDDRFVWGTYAQWQSLRSIADQLFQQNGLSVSTAQEAPTRDAIFGLVAAGLGLTVYPYIEKLSLRSDLVFVPISDRGAELSVHASWRRNPPAIIEGFIRHLSEA